MCNFLKPLPLQVQTYFINKYFSLDPTGSVPFSLQTENCSGVSFVFHSASGIFTIEAGNITHFVKQLSGKIISNLLVICCTVNYSKLGHLKQNQQIMTLKKVYNFHKQTNSKVETQIHKRCKPLQKFCNFWLVSFNPKFWVFFMVSA